MTSSQQLSGLSAEEGERSTEHRAAVEDLRSLSRYSPAKAVEQAKQRVAKAENGLGAVRARKSPIEDAMNEINLNELPQEFEKKCANSTRSSFAYGRRS